MTNTEPTHTGQDFADEEVCASREETFEGTMEFVCAKPLTGRYVVIRFTDSADRGLTLCEVEVDATAATGELRTKEKGKSILTPYISVFPLVLL